MMSSKKIQPFIAGLDIGSSKVSLVLGSITPDKKIEILGLGTAFNSGLRQGVVVNIEAATDAIRRAREEAELMSGCKIEEVFLSISGGHIQSFDSKGMVAIKNKEVSSHDVERVIEAAKAVAVPADRQILHVLPREYKVDGQDGILDPVGMSGIRLEANVHIVTTSSAALSNHLKCLEKAGLKCAGVVLGALAASVASLSEDEKKLGVALVDIGAGGTQLIYFVNSSVAMTSLVPVGGTHFTQDIAVGLRTPQSSAEQVKIKYGCAMSSLVSETETIEVDGVGGRKSRAVLRKDLSEVIEPRAEELLQLLSQDLKRSGLLPFLGSGVVLVGGGSLLEGFTDMGEFVLDIPVRRAIASGVFGLQEVVRSPAMVTAVGLLLYGVALNRTTRAHQVKKLEPSQAKESLDSRPMRQDGFGEKIKRFFEEMFENKD
jgi:cell division protein FtsA